MSTYFTADLHLFHDLVGRLRGFDDGASWTEYIDAYMSGSLGKRDHVWILGDMTVGSRIQDMLDIVAGWPGTKHLITGNHDPVGPHERKGYRLMRKYLDVFTSVNPYQRIRVNGTDLMLSHYPYSGDHTEDDRFEPLRLRDAGLPLLHGHTHSNEVLDPRRSEDAAPQIHVGWDAWERLVTESEIAHLLMGRGIR